MLVDLGSCCVFSRVRLCLVFFVRESPSLWRGFVTVLIIFWEIRKLKPEIMVDWKAPGIAHASQVVQKYTLITTICLSRLNTEILK